MCNEETAVLIKNGHNKYCIDLWENIKRFVFFCVCKTSAKYGEQMKRAGVTDEDLKQEGYLAMLDAVRYFEKEKGYKFITYMRYCLKNRFNAVLGVGKEKGNCFALNSAVRLEDRINESEKDTFEEMIKDEKAENEFLNIVEKCYTECLRKDLEYCLESLPQEERSVIKEIYFEERKISDMAKEKNVPYGKIKTVEIRGIRSLRNSKNMKRLEEYRNDIISTYGYRSGFYLWHNTGYSSTEFTALSLAVGKNILKYENKEKDVFFTI